MERRRPGRDHPAYFEKIRAGKEFPGKIKRNLFFGMSVFPETGSALFGVCVFDSGW